MLTYSYEGPVVMHGKCVQHEWKATTTAPSQSRAISNLKYRWRKENNYVNNIPLELPGTITVG